jgi:hypothetical protein
MAEEKMARLTGRDVAEQIRRALRGEIEVHLVNPIWSWDAIFAGDVPFLFGDWRITFFNDCDSLDYVDEAVDSAGRHVTYADDFSADYDVNGHELRSGSDPLMYTTGLADDERVQLERLLKAAT